MQTETPLRLVDPAVLLMGVALVMVAVCAFMIAWRFRVWTLFFVAAGLLVAAVPSLVKGGIDLLVWYGFASSDTYPPNWSVFLGGLRPYVMFLSASSIAFATYRLLHRRVSP